MKYLQQQFGWPDTEFAVFKMPRLIQPDPVTLSLQQLQELIKKEFGNSKQEQKMTLIRDMVVTGCIGALRYSDLISLRWSNIIEKEGKLWLELQSRKTGTICNILLPGFLVEILARYRRVKRLTIFPIISNACFNKLIKKMGQRMGWNEATKVFKCRNGLLTITNVGKFYEVLTSHVMRRSGITLMCQLGMKENLIRRISGHAPNSKDFYRYIKIAQKWQDEESERVHKQIAS
jgi:integrase